MKLNFNQFVLGVLIGVTATASVSAFGSEISKNINVVYRNIKIYADGNLVNTNESNEPFIYNGTTYLPIRTVGEALNKAVDWEPSTSSLYIGKRPTQGTSPTILLKDLDYFFSNTILKFGSYKDNLGNVYSNGIVYDNGRGSNNTEYLLNGRYSKFNGKIILLYDERSSERNSVIFNIYGDNKLLYTSKEVKAGVMPQNFNIDVNGVTKLKIEVINTDPTLSANVITPVIVDAGLYS